jgi:hypothetical protein
MSDQFKYEIQHFAVANDFVPSTKYFALLSGGQCFGSKQLHQWRTFIPADFKPRTHFLNSESADSLVYMNFNESVPKRKTMHAEPGNCLGLICTRVFVRGAHGRKIPSVRCDYV